MLLARANAFRLSAVVGESDGVISVSASACHNSGPKGVSPGQKALLHGINKFPESLCQMVDKNRPNSRPKMSSIKQESVYTTLHPIVCQRNCVVHQYWPWQWKRLKELGLLQIKIYAFIYWNTPGYIAVNPIEFSQNSFKIRSPFSKHEGNASLDTPTYPKSFYILTTGSNFRWISM